MKESTDRLDAAERVVVPRLRKAGKDAMADALAMEIGVLRRVSPKTPKLRTYTEGWIFGFAFAAALEIEGSRENPKE